MAERLLPECIIASLHRFHATSSVQDAANAVRERAELAGDELDSSLGLVRYIAWAIPAIGRSSKYCVRPVRMSGSSRRRTGFPRIEPDVGMLAPWVPQMSVRSRLTAAQTTGT